MTYDEKYIKILENEIFEAKKRLEPHDCGHIHTAISWMEHRIKEINESIRNNNSKE